MENVVLQKFREGCPSLGTFTALNNPLAVESLRYTGLDYVIVDTEHSPVGIESAAAQIAAAQAAGLTAPGEPGLLPHPGRRLGPRRPRRLHPRLHGDLQPGDAAAAPVRDRGLPGAHRGDHCHGRRGRHLRGAL